MTRDKPIRIFKDGSGQMRYCNICGPSVEGYVWDFEYGVICEEHYNWLMKND